MAVTRVSALALALGSSAVASTIAISCLGLSCCALFSTHAATNHADRFQTPGAAEIGPDQKAPLKPACPGQTHRWERVLVPGVERSSPRLRREPLPTLARL